jgi:hypothetical protein
MTTTLELTSRLGDGCTIDRSQPDDAIICSKLPDVLHQPPFDSYRQ